MKHFEDGFLGARDLKMFIQGWEPSQPTAVVALVHGIGEHSGRYAHVGGAFCDAGYALVGFDLRGHGKSAGRRGHTPSYETLMDDIARFIEWVAGRYPNLPIFLYGHSMGGNFVINYCLRRKSSLRGAIATGPALRLAFEPPTLKIALGRIIDHVWPSFTQPSGLDNSLMSRDSKVIQAYENDPLVHDRVSARLFVGFIAAGLWALEHASELSLPLLLMHGSADGITSEPASREFAERAGSLVTYRTWEGCYHEIHNEPEKDDVLRTMTDWIHDRIAQ